MTQSSSPNKGKFIASSLRIANQALTDAEALRASGSRNASYVLDLAAENILKALCSSEDIHIPRAESHLLDRVSIGFPMSTH